MRPFMRSLARPLLTVALALTAGCGGDDSSGIVVSRILLENASSLALEEFYYRTCGATEWGPDRLGAGSIAPGESRAFAVTQGCYDARVVRSNAVESTHLAVDIPRGGLYRLTIHE